VEDLSSIKKKLSIEVAPDVVSGELEKAYLKIAKTANVKGFRKGKVPRAILEKQYGPRVEYEVVGSLVNNSLYKAMIEHKVEPVSQPEIVESGAVEKGQPFCYQAEVEVRPEVVATNYTGLQLEKEKLIFKEEAVEQQLEQMAGSRVQLEVTKRETACQGDTVIIDFEGFINDTPFNNGMGKDYQLELGSNSFIPGFEEQLIGLKRDQQSDIEVTFPESYGAKELAGKPAVFKVTVKEIKEKIEPKVDDDFAREFGAESLADLKEKIRDKVSKQEEGRINAQLQEKLMDALIANNAFEIPEGMVQNQLLHLKDNFSQRLKSQGMSLEMLGMNEENFARTYRDMAAQQVKGELLLDSIAKQEELGIQDQEIEEKIQGIAQEAKAPLENIQKYFENAQAREGLKVQLLHDKVIEYLLAKAVLTEVEPPQETAVEEDV
jgi:trigger factor